MSTLQGAKEEMIRLATLIAKEPPKDDAAWTDWAKEREKSGRPQYVSEEEARADWLVFQQMTAGGYTKNRMAASYMQACKNMRLDPADPHWMVPQAGSPPKKCTLHPWQVIGADWLRRSKREADISPLLADGCGLGKTIQTLAAIYADYLDAAAGRIPGPYRPTLIVAPAILAGNWVNDNVTLLANALDVWLWQSRSGDMGTEIVPKSRLLNHSDKNLKQWIQSLDQNDPATLLQVVVTSYGTGVVRSLYLNGAHATTANAREAASKARQKAKEKTQGPEGEDDEDDEDNEDEEEADRQVEDKEGQVWNSTLAGVFLIDLIIIQLLAC
jgi:SNF2-related domain